VDDKQWQIIKPVIARLRASVMATAFGLLAGFALFLATALLVVRGGHEVHGEVVVGPHLGLLSNFYPGYSVTWGGAIVGFFYAAVTGGVAGWIVAWVYNMVALRGLKGDSPKS
jgi:hypothetical protein